MSILLSKLYQRHGEIFKMNKCLRCYYEWKPHQGVDSKECPSCKTRHWKIANALKTSDLKPLEGSGEEI